MAGLAGAGACAVAGWAFRGADLRVGRAGWGCCSGPGVAVGGGVSVPETGFWGGSGLWFWWSSASSDGVGGWKVTGGAGLTARRGARSAGLLGGVGWSGVLNVARGVRDRGTSRPCVGGFSSMPREPSRAEPVSPVVDRCGSSICVIEGRFAVSAWRGGDLFAGQYDRPVSSTVGGPWAAKETSPSPVYGAALLMRLRFYRLSRVRIPESPLSRCFR